MRSQKNVNRQELMRRETEAKMRAADGFVKINLEPDCPIEVWRQRMGMLWFVEYFPLFVILGVKKYPWKYHWCFDT
jgi:hypothetical protein